jgi:hypothetical protein
MITPGRAAPLLVLAVAASCDTPAGGRWPGERGADPAQAPPAAAVVRAQDLRLDASVEREAYVVGEPVYLILRLENTGTDGRRVFGSLDPSDGAVDVVIGDATGERVFVPLVEVHHDEGIMVDLVPGQPLGAVTPVFFGGAGWTFPEPGSYQVTAIYRTPGEDGRLLETRSAPVEIVVQRSTDGSGEFLVASSDASFGAGKFLAWQSGDHLAAGQQHLERLLREYPASALTPYVRSAFGHSLGRRFLDYRSREVRPPDCERALAHLGAAVDETLPAYIRIQNALTRARCAARGRDGAAARAAIGAALAAAGERPEYGALRARAVELQQNLNAPDGP